MRFLDEPHMATNGIYHWALQLSEAQLPPPQKESCVGETILYGSLMFLHILWKEALTTFVQANFSRIFVQQIALEDRGSVSIPRKGQMCLLPIIKTSGSSSPGFLSPFICWYHLALFASTWQEVGLGWGTSANAILWLLLVLWVKRRLSLTQSSCVFCWHPWNWVRL